MKQNSLRSKIGISLFVCFSLAYGSCNTKNNNARYQFFYYPNGILQTLSQMSDSKRNGTVTHYYKDGKVESLENYINDTINGEVFSFYPKGSLEQKSLMKMGVNDGPSYLFYEDGLIKEYRMWVNGEKEKYGEDYWDIPGRIKAVYFAHHDTLIYERFFDSTGVVIKTRGIPPTESNPKVN